MPDRKWKCIFKFCVNVYAVYGLEYENAQIEWISKRKWKRDKQPGNVVFALFYTAVDYLDYIQYICIRPRCWDYSRSSLDYGIDYFVVYPYTSIRKHVHCACWIYSHVWPVLTVSFIWGSTCQAAISDKLLHATDFAGSIWSLICNTRPWKLLLFIKNSFYIHMVLWIS